MYAPPATTSYVWVPSSTPPLPQPTQPLPLHPQGVQGLHGVMPGMFFAPPLPTSQPNLPMMTLPPPPPPPAAPAVNSGGWVYVPAGGPPVVGGPVPGPAPMAAVPAPPQALLPQPLPGAAPTVPTRPSAVPRSAVTRPSAMTGPKMSRPGDSTTVSEADKTWLDAETGAVNVRVLLLKSRDIRRKLRAALYHAGRPQYRLSANERAKASRCSEYAALLRVIDATARECGMLPRTEEVILAHADALSMPPQDESSDSASSADKDKPSGEPREEPQPASWSLEGMRDVFLVTPGAAGLGSADEHFAAAHELYHRTHGAGAVTDRAEIFAVLYRKFVIAAAAHIVALRNHRN